MAISNDNYETTNDLKITEVINTVVLASNKKNVYFFKYFSAKKLKFWEASK
jgi:hypothetical protein